MTNNEPPPQHCEMLDMLRTCAENAPDSLREHMLASLASYEAGGTWRQDDLSLYE